MTPIKTLHTDRLTLRPVDPEKDAAAFHKIFSHPDAMRFMPNLPHDNINQTENSIQMKISRPGAYLWAICLKDSDEAIGEVHRLGQTRVPGLGYILHPDYWGRGMTVEACRAALDFCFDETDDDRMELWIDETNVQSCRVAQKLGFQPKARFAQRYNHRAYHHHNLVYGITAAQWRGETAPIQENGQLFRIEPVLHVKDVTESAHFYRDKLGFEIDFFYGDPPNYSIVSRGDWSGNLMSIHLSQSAEPHEINPTGHFIVFMDSGIDALYERYRDNGVDIISIPANKPWGMREFIIKDINGYQLLFSTNII
ncbi:MAG: GNAT family N-acetyltransferase [Aggregatilineales bacterium]